MRTNIRFIGLEGFKHHTDFIQKAIDSSVGVFDQKNKFTSDVTIRKESGKFKSSSDLFICELNFFGDKKRGQMFFKKHGKTFYEAAKKTFLAAEKSLRRESKTRQTRMRKNHAIQTQLINQNAA